MTLTFILSGYIARQFMIAVLAMLLALSGIVAMFDFIELLRRSASKPEATFALVSQISGLRLPFIAMQILPFAVLLGGILCFWRLTRSSELIVARASGVSAWQFLTAPTVCAIVLGITATAGLSPVSSLMLARAEILDNAYLRTGGGPLGDEVKDDGDHAHQHGPHQAERGEFCALAVAPEIEHRNRNRL